MSCCLATWRRPWLWGTDCNSFSQRTLGDLKTAFNSADFTLACDLSDSCLSWFESLSHRLRRHDLLSIQPRASGYSMASRVRSLTVISFVVQALSHTARSCSEPHPSRPSVASIGIILLTLWSLALPVFGTLGFRWSWDPDSSSWAAPCTVTWFGFERPIARLKGRLAPSRQQPESQSAVDTQVPERVARIAATAGSVPGEAY